MKKMASLISYVNLRKIITVSAILFAMTMSAQEICSLNPGNELRLDQDNGSSLSEGTIVGETNSIVCYLGADDTYKPNSYSFTVNGSVITGGLQGSSNPKDENGDNPNISLEEPVSGAFLVFEAKADGYLYVMHKAYSNKAYTVFEEGAAISYSFAAIGDASTDLGAVYNFTLPYEVENEQFVVKESIEWAEQEFLKATNPSKYNAHWHSGVWDAIRINGLGVIKFHVSKGKNYIVNANGSKITCAGFVFAQKGNVTIKSDGMTIISDSDEAIPSTYTLTVTSLGNGSVSYDGNTVRDKSTSFSVNEGTNATITFTPDNGYRIKSIKVNNSDVINNVSNNRYTINNISSNTTLNVEFEAIPPTIYTLTISATGSGHVSCNDISVENGTQSISIESGLSVIIKFYPNDGHQIKIAKVNNANVTSSISNNQYTIKIDSNKTVEVEFEEIVNSMIVDGVNYVVNDQQDNTIQVVAGDYGLVLEVPVSVVYNNRNWTVVGIEQDALTSCKELAAVIWEPKAQFNAMLKNPNFLLYVSDEKYASRSVKNVVVNGVAESIELTDDANGNDFYCPRVFKAKSIIYKHNYQMETGIGDSRGWETIVLPFDVQKYTHATKGELESFTTWSKGSSKKPFWLFELTTSGYKDVAGIKANIPYISSMPNNQQYEQQYQIPGVVTFSASNVEVQKTDNLKPVSYQGRSFVPNYTNKSDENYLVLNVSNNYVTNPGKDISGSKFVRGLRAVHPFEAYMTTTDNTRSIDVIEGMTTAIRGIQMVNDGAGAIKVYDTRGILMKTATSIDDVKNGLKAGVYIVNGKKMIIK